MATNYIIRCARPDEEGLLTGLTLRSKAHWGYDGAFMQAAIDDLRFRPEKFLPDWHVYILEQGTQLIGFCSLIPYGDAIELHDLFVEPRWIGQGYGKHLWDHAVRVSRELGFSRMTLLADPHAEAFYQRQGAVRIGTRASTIDVSRMLPLMEVQISS